MPAIGTVGTVATDAHIDELWVDFFEIFVTDSEPLNCAGSEVLNDDVCSLGKFLKYGDTLFALQVNNEGSLAAIVVDKDARHATFGRSEIAHEVTNAW